MNAVGYYPGCSQSGSAREYDLSIRALAGAMQIDLKEIPDWVCCGASSAHAINQAAAFALAADSLIKARRAGMDCVLAPCAMCYSRLATAVHSAKNNPAMAQATTKALSSQEDLDLRSLRVINVLTWLESLPSEDLAKRIVHPLNGLKVACYYGCLLVRPPQVTGARNAEAPRNMEGLVRRLGAEPVRWSMATECCGACFSLSCKPVVLRQGRQIFEAARSSGADVIVLACPMCHSNLDMRQAEFAAGAKPIPVLYLTQLIGLAIGMSADALRFSSHFVPVEPVLAAAPPGGTREG